MGIRWAYVALAGALGFISACLDVISFVKYTSFPGLQTGNMIFIGRALFELTEDTKKDPTLPTHAAVIDGMGYHIAMLASNFVGVFIFCILVDYSRFPVLWAAPLIGLCTIVTGVLDIGLDGSKWAVCFCSASLGAMNFISSPNTPLQGKLFAMTTLATGNLQKCAKMAHHAAFGHKFSAVDRQSTLNATSVVVCNILGAIVGGLALGAGDPFGKRANTSWTYIPLGVAQTLILVWHDYVLRPRPPAETTALVEPLSANTALVEPLPTPESQPAVVADGEPASAVAAEA